MKKLISKKISRQQKSMNNYSVGKELSPFMLGSWNALFSSADFFEIDVFEKKIQEYNQNIKQFGYR